MQSLLCFFAMAAVTVILTDRVIGAKGEAGEEVVTQAAVDEAGWVISEAQNAGPLAEAIASPPPALLNRQPSPAEPLESFEDLTGWRIKHPAGVEVRFYRSGWRAITGEHAACLWMPSGAEGASIWLLPPQPLPLHDRADAAETWVFRQQEPPHLLDAGQFETHKTQLTLHIRDERGLHRVQLSPVHWAFWSIAHHAFEEPIGPTATLEAIEVRPSQHDRVLYLDALTFYTHSREPVPASIPDMPFPTTPDTILPQANAPTAYSVRQEGEAFVLESRGRQILRYTYIPRIGTLGDLVVHVDGDGPYQPLASGGVAGLSDYRLLTVGTDDGAVRAKWQAQSGGRVVNIDYTFRVKGKSLIVDVACSVPAAPSFEMGAVAQASSVEPIDVPYLTYMDAWNSQDAYTVFLLDRKLFISRFFDWYQTGATRLSSTRSHYDTATDGRRKPVVERVFAPHCPIRSMRCCPTSPTRPRPTPRRFPNTSI
ncbi:MAG TPA: hypothetical protein VF184_07890 [Phycisphaeraceae bacterium]